MNTNPTAKGVTASDVLQDQAHSGPVSSGGGWLNTSAKISRGQFLKVLAAVVFAPFTPKLGEAACSGLPFWPSSQTIGRAEVSSWETEQEVFILNQFKGHIYESSDFLGDVEMQNSPIYG